MVNRDLEEVDFFETFLLLFSLTTMCVQLHRRRGLLITTNKWLCPRNHNPKSLAPFHSLSQLSSHYLSDLYVLY